MPNLAVAFEKLSDRYSELLVRYEELRKDRDRLQRKHCDLCGHWEHMGNHDFARMTGHVPNCIECPCKGKFYIRPSITITDLRDA